MFLFLFFDHFLSSIFLSSILLKKMEKAITTERYLSFSNTMPFMKAEHLSLVSITYYSKMPGDSSLIGLRCAVKMFLFSLAQGWLMLLNLSRPTYIIYLNSLFYYGHQWYLPQNKEMYVNIPSFTLMCKSIFRLKSFIFSCTIL